MYFAMYPLKCLTVLLCALLASGAQSRKFLGKRNNGNSTSSFVSTQDGQFRVNGSDFKFIGTTAYWLHALNTDEDIINTFSNMSAHGIKVVRTWGFNDVETIPENGTWFQLVANGTTMVNTGPNGLQRLDRLIDIAEQFGIYVQVSLTNNWNPRPLLDNATLANDTVFRRDVTPFTNNSLPRNTLSNDYGGMDVYVRQFGMRREHDEFYTNETILNAFKNYTTQVVSRYVNRTSVFAWELANDPRCNSSISANPSCTAQTVTRWHSDVAQHIASIDPNHLISSGHQGFFCVGCPKLFPRVTPPPPQVSPAPGQRRRSLPPPLTKARLLKERRQARKRNRLAKKHAGELTSGIRIRGNWVATPTRRQDESDLGVGPAFDGSQGVDSEDIINIPQIGFGTFQYFPDQNSYGFDDPNLSPFENTVQQGLDWIQRQSEVGTLFGKPMSLTGFGLVTKDNLPFFTPFNTSVAPFAADAGNAAAIQREPIGVTDQQRDTAYQQWINAGIVGGLNGIIQYQWGQTNLTTQPGTTISPAITSNSASPNQGQTGTSPNDGYSIQGVGQESVQSILGTSAQQIAADTS